MPNALRELAHALAALSTNCRDFDDAWEDAPPSGGIAGRWRGEWRSDEHSHHGPMECVLRAPDERHAEAFFHAEYMKVLRVCYRVELRIERAGESFQLKGEADLGRLAGGVYQYSGELTRNRFLCTYRCQFDHGTFHLQPVQQTEDTT